MSTYKLYKVYVPEEHDDRSLTGPYVSALVRDDEAVAFTSWRLGQTEADKIRKARMLHGHYNYVSIYHLCYLGDRELIDTFER